MEDAHLGVKAGVYGIVISNYDELALIIIFAGHSLKCLSGGRQYDRAVGFLDVLPQCGW